MHQTISSTQLLNDWVWWAYWIDARSLVIASQLTSVMCNMCMSVYVQREYWLEHEAFNRPYVKLRRFNDGTKWAIWNIYDLNITFANYCVCSRFDSIWVPREEPLNSSKALFVFTFPLINYFLIYFQSHFMHTIRLTYTMHRSMIRLRKVINSLCSIALQTKF